MNELIEKFIENGFKKDVGNVYVIEKEDGCCKIGCSVNPISRIKCICMTGGIINHKHFISEKCIGHNAIERIIHNSLKDKRYHGEWFKCDIETCKSLIEKEIKKSKPFAEKLFSERKNNYISAEDKLVMVENIFRPLNKNFSHNLWGNWICSDNIAPSKPFSNIIAHDISLGITVILEYDEKTEKYLYPEDWCEFIGSIDLWMPVIMPIRI